MTLINIQPDWISIGSSDLYYVNPLVSILRCNLFAWWQLVSTLWWTSANNTLKSTLTLLPWMLKIIPYCSRPFNLQICIVAAWICVVKGIVTIITELWCILHQVFFMKLKWFPLKLLCSHAGAGQLSLLMLSIVCVCVVFCLPCCLICCLGDDFEEVLGTVRSWVCAVVWVWWCM